MYNYFLVFIMILLNNVLTCGEVNLYSQFITFLEKKFKYTYHIFIIYDFVIIKLTLTQTKNYSLRLSTLS